MDTLESLSLKQIQYFAAVAEYGSFRQAAFRLNITQPTLSNQVAAMEKTLKIQLFERSRKGITTTPQGRELLLSARRILEEAQGFTTQAALLSGGGMGTYRLGVTPTLGPYLLPHILSPIHNRYHELKLYVREDAPSDLETGLINGQHDLILSTLPIMSNELVVAPLFREPLKLAIARDHRLGEKKRINRMDLLGEPVLTISEHHLFHKQITDLCERVGAVVRRDYEGTSLD
ncbi:MAG: LysR family transcriptional regulator, partial [Pseudomonadales bacterium]|nr:LysR family transcriptional regulator [Pseudomonadales bacterium]